MYVSWSADSRPTWRVRLVFRLVRGTQDPPGRGDAIALQAAMVSTGLARAPVIRFGGGEAQMTALVKATGEIEATALALGILDHVVADGRRVVLGDLLWRASERWPSGPGVQR